MINHVKHTSLHQKLNVSFFQLIFTSVCFNPLETDNFMTISIQSLAHYPLTSNDKEFLEDFLEILMHLLQNFLKKGHLWMEKVESFISNMISIVLTFILTIFFILQNKRFVRWKNISVVPGTCESHFSEQCCCKSKPASLSCIINKHFCKNSRKFHKIFRVTQIELLLIRWMRF